MPAAMFSRRCIAAGIRADRIARAARQVHQIQRPIDLLPELVSRQSVELPEERQVLARVQLRIERELLRHDAEHPPCLDRSERMAGDLRGPVIGLHQPAEHVDRRRLPGAVRTEQPVDFRAPHREADAADRFDLAEPLSQRLRAQRERHCRRVTSDRIRRAAMVGDRDQLIAPVSLRASRHLDAEAQRTHVGPDLFDEREDFVLRAGLAGIAPAGRIRLVRRPDRVLLFVVDDGLVDGLVFCLVRSAHLFSPTATA